MHAFSNFDRAIEFTKFKLCTRDQFPVGASLASWEITLTVQCPWMELFSLLPCNPSKYPCSCSHQLFYIRFRSNLRLSIQIFRDCFVRFNVHYVRIVNAPQLAMGSPSRGAKYASICTDPRLVFCRSCILCDVDDTVSTLCLVKMETRSNELSLQRTRRLKIGMYQTDHENIRTCTVEILYECIEFVIRNLSIFYQRCNWNPIIVIMFVKFETSPEM